MDISLFDVSGTLLERNVLFLSTDLDIAANDTEGLSRSQYVEQRGLSGSTSTHKCSELTGLAITVHFVQQLSLSTRHLDSVVL